jgi:hypothetical protein
VRQDSTIVEEDALHASYTMLAKVSRMSDVLEADSLLADPRIQWALVEASHPWTSFHLPHRDYDPFSVCFVLHILCPCSISSEQKSNLCSGAEDSRHTWNCRNHFAADNNDLEELPVEKGD